MMPLNANVLNCVLFFCFFYHFPSSIRPVWGPPIYLWLMPRSDTLGLTSRCSLLPTESLFREALYETLGSYQGGCLHGIILFTGAAARRPNLRHESRPYEAITSVTHPCSALKALHAVLNRRLPVQDHLKTVIVVMMCGNTAAQIKSLWTEWIKKCLFAFPIFW